MSATQSAANNISARDVQKRHTQFFKGKSLDRTCPMGPFLMHRHDVPDVARLGMKLWVNGELRQNSHTGNMIFSVDQIISQLSQGMTLYPGDIILTGTPAGVGYAMKPPQTLKSGDVMRLEIDSLGCLENTVSDDNDDANDACI